MSMTKRIRVRVVAASCMLVLALAVLLTGARVFAAAHSSSRCGSAVVAAPAVGGPTAAKPAAAPAAPAVSDRAAYGRAAGSWRSHALRAVGCGAWNGMHHRTRQKHHTQASSRAG
jgi:hypothetical protein